MLKKLKRQAEILSQETGLTHTKSLELASRLNGFKNYHQVTAECKVGEFDQMVWKKPEWFEREADQKPFKGGIE